MIRLILSLILFSAFRFLFAQDFSEKEKQRMLRAYPLQVNEKINIDGMLDETCWSDLAVPLNFWQMEPYPGKPSLTKTSIKIAYNNSAIYIAVKMFDPYPDSILRELGTRDVGENNADVIAVFFDTYQDGQNAFGFMVSSSGIQTDAKYSSSVGQDIGWNAVWYSATKITTEGWNAEFKIPHSSIRFPDKSGQEWGLNFIRIDRRHREKSTWNFFDKKIPGFVNQFGTLSGLSQITAPLRLSFTPYLSTYLQHYPYEISGKSNFSTSLNGGMDLKFGITESYTLDMTLIPDFGQVQSDNLVLNLSPFEVKYEEKRQFFTEGTELFSRGGIFYSRRIAGIPEKFYEAATRYNNSLVKNPDRVQLINATKISGRSKKGNGIGFFNAITSATEAIYKDSLWKEHSFETEPGTNYNILVVEKNLPNNSYLSFINTNVFRGKNSRKANVAGTDFKIINPSQKYSVDGSMLISHIWDKVIVSTNSDNSTQTGISYEMTAGKTGGSFHYTFSHRRIDDKYDPNDLGFLDHNNSLSYSFNLNYDVYKPFWKFLKFQIFGGSSINRLVSRDVFTSQDITAGIHSRWIGFIDMGWNSSLVPGGGKDYFFEPTVQGRYYKYPTFLWEMFWVSTDYRKPLAIDVSMNHKNFHKTNRNDFGFEISPRVRATDRLFFDYSFAREYKDNDVGYAGVLSSDSIIFGERNVNTWTQLLSSQYIFTSKMSVLLKVRHYLSEANYNNYSHLKLNGETEFIFTANSIPAGFGFAEKKKNYNVFTLDLGYVWEFSAGSELRIVWKNLIEAYRSSESNGEYFENLNGTLDENPFNTFSVKFLYFIDYLEVKNLKKKNNRE